MPVNIPPTCPHTHIFNNESCVCIPKKTQVKMNKLKVKKHNKKLRLTAKTKKTPPSPKKIQNTPIVKSKRCPNGTRRDKKTGECVSKTFKKSLSKKEPLKKITFKKVTLKKEIFKKIIDAHEQKRLEKKQEKAVPKTKKLITIKNTTPFDDQLISNAISRTLKESKSKKPKMFMELLTEVRQDLIQNKSFSPSVNKRLVSLRNVKATSIFGCGLEDVLRGKVAASPKTLKIKMKTSPSGKPVCGSYKSAAAKNLMLNNLAASKILNCGKVVAPLQLQTNCWFNTMYMAFFVSDKGRKFFRFLRQLMIEGRQENRAEIKPPRLAQALFLFNAYIESSYNLDDSAKTIMAEGMDTNILIDSIYKSIPKKYKIGDIKVGLKVSGEYGNPLSYYQAIISYLSNDSLKLYVPSDYSNMQEETMKLFKPSHQYTGDYYMPDVIVVRTWDNMPMFNKMIISDRIATRQLSFTRIYAGKSPPKGKPKEAKYVLDSAIVRSTNQEHFCALITCNGKSMAFDGSSLVRLGELSWKTLLNKDTPWTFANKQDEPDDLRWNFMSSYQQLYYYRV